MKPERTQDNLLPDLPDRDQQPDSHAEGWQADTTPIAITRRFPTPSFSAAVGYLLRITSVLDDASADRHCRVSAITIDEGGVTIRIGSPATPGITETELELAAALTKAA